MANGVICFLGLSLYKFWPSAPSFLHRHEAEAVRLRSVAGPPVGGKTKKQLKLCDLFHILWDQVSYSSRRHGYQRLRRSHSHFWSSDESARGAKDDLSCPHQYTTQMAMVTSHQHLRQQSHKDMSIMDLGGAGGGAVGQAGQHAGPAAPARPT